MNRKASVLWKGNFQDGVGTLSTESGAICEMKFSVRSRNGKGPGTSPEELFAAAVATCFSMELAREFGICGVPVGQINATATAHIQPMRARPTVTRIQIDLVARGQDPKGRFVEAAQTAVHCPTALLLNATIDMTAALNSLTTAGKNGP
jgi:osmotically inducible protein OsmC